MKVFNVIGFSKTGKTTTIEEIIKELKKRNYSVGSIKDIHFEEFAIDTPGTNTDRHKKAGSELVTARGLFETDVLFQRQLDIYQIAKFYDFDFLVIEGYSASNTPKILTGATYDDLDNKVDDSIFLISGKIAENIDEYKGIRAISALDDIEKIVDIIEERTFKLLPDFDPDCCTACGYSCRQLLVAILKGESTRDDCIIDSSKIKLTIDDKEIPMVPFVQKILQNTVEAVVKELDGYKSNSKIKIEIND
jgi:molybdopterin-guanine dinucleotide biosynthesis protein B